MSNALLVCLGLATFVVSYNCLSIWQDVGSLFQISEGAFRQVENGMKHISSAIKFAEEFLNDVIEEDCQFRCPNGEKPKKKPHHISIPNGCGSLGFQVSPENLPIAELTLCCDHHDICYDTCNMSKDKCDNEFKKCLYAICERQQLPESYKRCKVAAKVLYTGTNALGCKSYKEAQSNACVCNLPKKSKHFQDL